MTKILLVEDDPVINKMYSRLFKLEGYEVVVAVDGLDGLEKLKTFTPDIIMLDIMMPKMNGVEMLGKIKENPSTQNIPTIVLTNMSDMRVSNEIFAKGVNLSIIKSEMEPDMVISWVKSVLAKAQKDTGTPAQ